MTLTHARPVGFFASLIASLGLAFAVGCASGGFKLTRSYAQFVNRQNVVLRVVIYLLTSVVFMATLLIDLVFNNTLDFWDGRVAAGEYSFNREGRTYVAQHEILPGSPLKRSTIKVFDARKTLLQTVVLQETSAGEIEMHVNGHLRTKVRDIASLPMISSYDADGRMISDRLALVEMSSVTLAAAGR